MRQINMFTATWMILMGSAFAAEKHIILWQFIGTKDPNVPFIAIEEYGYREIHYKSVEPNLADDFYWKMNDCKTYPMKSEAAFWYVVHNWPRLYMLDTLSKFWTPTKQVVIEPNLPIEPNVLPDPNSPSGYVMCFSDAGKIYHDPNCPYAKQRKTAPISESKLDEYNPCPICRPDIVEMLKDVNDIELKEAIKKLMEIEK